MGFDSQKDRRVAMVAAGGLAFVVLGTVFLAAYLIVFGLCFAAARAALNWGFAGSADTSSAWRNVAAAILAVFGTALAGRAFDRTVLLVRRLRGRSTSGRHATTVRQDIGQMMVGGVKWAELLTFIAIGVPAVLAAVYIVRYAKAWFDLTPFASKVLVVVLAFAIAYPALRVRDTIAGAMNDRRAEP